MNLRSITTWVLLLGIAFISMAFDRDNDDFYFYLNTYRTFMPGEQVQVSIGGNFTSDTKVTFRLYGVTDPLKFFGEQQNVHTPGAFYDEESDKMTNTLDLSDKSMFKQQKEWTRTIESGEYWRNDEIDVPTTERGVYIVEARAKGRVATTAVIVSSHGMILKRSGEELLAYVLDRTNGHKAPAARLVVRRQGVEKQIERTADGNGVARIQLDEFPAPTSEEGDEMRWGYGTNDVVFGIVDGNFIISDSWYYSYWGRGGNNGQGKVYLHTDRPVYRPAQTVYYRGILRDVEKNGTYTLPASKSVVVVVFDSRGGEIMNDTVAISDMGTFHGELILSDEPPLGDYSMQVRSNGVDIGGSSFAVEEYKKPEYEVTVSTDKASYTRGERVNATLQADYYFGAPVAEATVEYRILRSQYWRPWWLGSEWEYLYKGMPMYAPYGAEYVDGGQGTLKPDGSFEFSFLTARGEEEVDYNYEIVATVVDASRRAVSGSTVIRATRGEFYLTANTDRYVYKPGDKVTLNVGSYSFEGDKGVPTAFDVVVKRTWWENGYEKSKEEKLWSGSGKTGADGTGRITFDAPKEGYLTAEVTATDKRGNAITTSASVYVADREYAYWDTQGGAQIIPDRDLYKPGETLSALVIMPVSGADVLVTAEGPTIFNYRVERLGGNSAIIRIPIEESFAPTFFIGVSTMVGDRMYTAERMISVVPEGKLIRLAISTDKSEYKPGEKGMVTVRALNADGEPAAETDVAVALVDEAIYAIRPDGAPDVTTFFYGVRWNEVQTTSSLDFRFYNQAVTVESQAAVGEGSFGGAEMYDSAVPANAKAADRAMAPPPPAPAPGLVQPTIRKDFRDLMFWTHSVRTDASGYARIPVTFPDNLTTWRITARGVTRATEVGQATAEVVATKNLLVRMETPRFITKGDELVIATTVHNYLDTPKEVTVEFAAKGLKQEARTKKVTIAANGEERIDWKVKAEQFGDAMLTVKALTDEESDAMELVVPVYPQGVRVGTSAITDIAEPSGSRTMTLAIPSNADPATGAMTVSLSPSAGASMLGALDELIGYPYGCVEQTMSRFLPTVVVSDVLQDLNVPFNHEKKDEIPKMVEKGLARLYALQHDDGGWGWWEHDETNPFMTAYVVYGLSIAGEAGHDVSPERFLRGTTKLYQMIESGVAGGGMSQQDQKLSRTTEAYMLYVLSVADPQGSEAGLARDRVDDLADEKALNNYATALLAMAASNYNDAATARRLADRLVTAAKTTASSAHWSGQTWHYNWEDDVVETSAAAVKALLQIQGETDVVKKGVRWLLAQKTGEAWHNTRQTAMVIYSLSDYLRASNELNPNYTLVVKVNGREVLSRKITSEDVFKPEVTLTIDAGFLRKGDNTVTVEKEGEGRLYASTRLNYYATGSAIAASDAGFKVKREYYVLRRVKKGDRFVYNKEKFTGTLKSGDEIFVKLTVTPDSRYEYFMMEDPLPAGCEVITDTDGYEIVGENDYGDDDEYPYYRGGWDRMWNWWYADRDVRDEKVAFFSQSVQPQAYELSYVMRAQIPGSYSVMPSVASLMYYPEVRGNGGVENVVITE